MAAVGGVNVVGGSFTVNDPNFTAILPAMIDYAELRILRDLDILGQQATATQQLTTGTRSQTVPSFVTLEQVNVITPYTVTQPDSGTRNPLLPVTTEFLNYVCGSPSYTATPIYYAPLLQYSTGSGSNSVQTINTIYVGPFPDQTYTIELIGVQRPVSLSAITPTTFISENLPDLFLMASLIYMALYQRNFGRAADDPQMAMSYESQYQSLLKGAMGEEARKKFQSAGWTSKSAAVMASPSRG